MIIGSPEKMTWWSSGETTLQRLGRFSVYGLRHSLCMRFTPAMRKAVAKPSLRFVQRGDGDLRGAIVESNPKTPVKQAIEDNFGPGAG